MNLPNPKRIAKGLWWDRAWRLTTGCTKCTAGCNNCWAEVEAEAKRLHPNPKVVAQYAGLFDGTGVAFLPQNLEKPLHVKRPTVWAVWNDLFHDAISYRDIHTALTVMAQTPQHTYILCTKRPENAAAVVCQTRRHYPALTQLKNVVLMTSTESQHTYNLRADIIAELHGFASWLPALSVEPMLTEIELHSSNFAWIVCGGESGKAARPIEAEWVRSLRDQCREREIPFFFKQWGIGHARTLDGKKYSEFPGGEVLRCDRCHEKIVSPPDMITHEDDARQVTRAEIVCESCSGSVFRGLPFQPNKEV